MLVHKDSWNLAKHVGQKPGVSRVDFPEVRPESSVAEPLASPGVLDLILSWGKSQLGGKA